MYSYIRTEKKIVYPGSWYGLGTGLKLADWQGGWLQGSVRAALYEIPAFQRGGSVLVAFETAGDSLKTTQQKSNLTALVALNCPIKPRMLGADPKVSCDLSIICSCSYRLAVDVHCRPQRTYIGRDEIGGVSLHI